MNKRMIFSVLAILMVVGCGGGGSSSTGSGTTTTNAEPPADPATFDQFDMVVVGVIQANLGDLQYQPPQSEIDCVRALDANLTFEQFNQMVRACIDNNG